MGGGITVEDRVDANDILGAKHGATCTLHRVLVGRVAMPLRSQNAAL